MPRLFLLLLAIGLPHGSTQGRADEIEDVVVKLDVNEFRANFPVFRAATRKDSEPNAKAQKAPSPLDTRAVSLIYKTDSTKVPPTQMRAEIIIFEKGKAKNILEVKDFRSLRAEWVDEEILKIVSWPGRCVQLVELVNAKTGAVLYRSATGSYPKTTYQ